MNLDSLQRKAIYSTSQNSLIVAAPGSGKTTVIISRILYLMGELKVKPEHIVVITFTRAAADNMKKRYLKLSQGESTPYFGTLHSLFYKILENYYSNIKIIEASEAYKLIYTVLLSYLDEISEEKVKEALNNISFFKTSNQSLENFKPSFDKNAFIECLDSYEALKKTNGLLDFDDLQIMCRKLFLERKKVLLRYREKFKYILVDEFQDTDEVQIDILKMLNSNNSIFAVGDEDQSIYGFRGSKPSYMVEFKKIFKNSEIYFLETNYRSPVNIVEASSKLISHNISRNNKTIKAFKNYSRKIQIVKCAEEGEQAEKISEVLQELGEGIKDSAIIYRTNKECARLIDIFIRKKIPFNLLDKGYNLYEHFVCKDIIAYIKLSLDNCNRESFIRIINKPYRFISKLNLERIKRYNIKEDVFDIFTNGENVSFFQIKQILNLRKKINKIKKLTTEEAVNYIFKDLEYCKFVEEFCTKNKLDLKVVDAIKENFIASASDFNTHEDFLEHVESVHIAVNQNTEGVILSSIHGVKGMEFRNLFIINCNCDNIPYSKNNHINLEEERRLFYVAVTRTVENLWIYYNEVYNGVSKQPSIFIKECGLL